MDNIEVKSDTDIEDNHWRLGPDAVAVMMFNSAQDCTLFLGTFRASTFTKQGARSGK